MDRIVKILQINFQALYEAAQTFSQASFEDQHVTVIKFWWYLAWLRTLLCTSLIQCKELSKWLSAVNHKSSTSYAVYFAMLACILSISAMHTFPQWHLAMLFLFHFTTLSFATIMMIWIPLDFGGFSYNISKTPFHRYKFFSFGKAKCLKIDVLKFEG